VAKKKRKFFLKLESKSSNLKLIREFVVRIAQEADFNEEDMHKIELAVDEACSNVVKHAYPDNENNSIEIEVSFDSRAFNVKVQDRGCGFDPNRLPQTDMKTYLEKYQVGGLGIHLMKSLMDLVEYNINPAKKNQVILTKFRN